MSTAAKVPRIPPRPPRRRWEHRFFDVPSEETANRRTFEAALDRYGDEGWELFSVVLMGGGAVPILRHYFKRPLEQKEPNQ